MSTIHEDAEAIRSPDARLKHFASLAPQRRYEALQRMRLDGHSVYGIAAATGLSVEQVQAILGER